MKEYEIDINARQKKNNTRIQGAWFRVELTDERLQRVIAVARNQFRECEITDAETGETIFEINTAEDAFDSEWHTVRTSLNDLLWELWG